MELKGKKIGVALTGSFCTYKKVFQELEKLAEEGAQIQTIFSDAAQSIDSRFGKAEDFVKEAQRITGRKPMLTISEAEPIGPGSLLDLLILSPVQEIPLQSWPTALQIPPPLWRLKPI